MYFHDKTNRPQKNSRFYDFQQLDKASRSSDPAERGAAIKAKEELKRERYNPKITSMRESLIKAHREGNHGEIKDIGDYVSKHKEYQNNE